MNYIADTLHHIVEGDVYKRQHQFPAIIIRPCNNYGPWQYPEKFIPVIIYKAMKNEKIPVYGQGLNIREWLYVCLLYTSRCV